MGASQVAERKNLQNNKGIYSFVSQKSIKIRVKEVHLDINKVTFEGADSHPH